ncbi:hypothetical protein ACGFYE_32505 [Streptomyces zaomyceticus]|uniref:hypothetical protein n=1 Tax=Streptomyces zaomyceticus TaxID=68286 RepID=UPI00371499C2
MPENRADVADELRQDPPDDPVVVGEVVLPLVEQFPQQLVAERRPRHREQREFLLREAARTPLGGRCHATEDGLDAPERGGEAWGERRGRGGRGGDRGHEGVPT